MPIDGQQSNGHPRHEGHDAGKPEGVVAHPAQQRDDEHPGYEIQDVNVGGIVTFIAGLSGFIVIFFVFCFLMGKGINFLLAKQDGPADQWHQNTGTMGETPHGAARENLASDAAIEQKQFAQMTEAFPTPRLETDDGNQDTADLHAREDLLLNYSSTSSDLQGGAVRIPIGRAMQLIVQRGLPQPPVAVAAPLMVGDSAPTVQAPLTSGFARTGYELDTIEARHQRMDFEKAVTAEK
jgi:hypothetical protein